MSAQDALRDAWFGGQEGRRCGREQARAWALREVWLEEKQDQAKPEYGMYEFCLLYTSDAADE